MIKKKKKTFVVTGGTGFIGSNISKLLIKKNYNVKILDNNSRGNLNKFKEFKKKYTFIKGDIRNRKTVNRAFKNADAVVHLAYVNGTKYFYKHPVKILDIAVKGILNVLESCMTNNIKELYLASSSEVYQTPSKIPTDENETLKIPDIYNPRYSYGGGKIISELLAINYGRSKIKRVVIFRPHNVYGPDMGWEHVVPEFVLKMDDLISTQASQSIDFKIQGTGNETRAFIFIDDFVDGLFRVIEHGQHLNVYHIGTSNEIKLSDLAQQIASLFEAKIDIIPGDLAQGGTLRRCPDIAKLKGLGFDPQTTMEDGLKVTKKWYVENKHLKPITIA